MYGNGLFTHADCELRWLGTDTEQAFRSNKECHPQLMERWHEHSVSYRINSHGFRGDDPTSTACAVFLGCSHTFGIGLPEDQTWPRLVSEGVGLPCVNLGVNGGSNDTAFRLARYWLPRLDVRVVFWLHTYKARLELLVETDALNYSPNFDHDDFYLSWVSVEENLLINFDKNLRGIRSMCNEVSARLITLAVEGDLLYLDKARDLAHSGVESNRDLAKKALCKFTE